MDVLEARTMSSLESDLAARDPVQASRVPKILIFTGNVFFRIIGVCVNCATIY